MGKKKEKHTPPYILSPPRREGCVDDGRLGWCSAEVPHPPPRRQPGPCSVQTSPAGETANSPGSTPHPTWCLFAAARKPECPRGPQSGFLPGSAWPEQPVACSSQGFGSNWFHLFHWFHWYGGPGKQKAPAGDASAGLGWLSLVSLGQPFCRPGCPSRDRDARQAPPLFLFPPLPTLPALPAPPLSLPGENRAKGWG